ncbi:DUF2894 domain-containing protein [Caballeronia humi]|uniref:DUF2894 domain-containing protein n=1 Tax=Caballeronia humi TaxID=326474 RepID=A0A158GR34_9BURK|nr:DUF2894 domain-containing protein [Caballeronia humi]SAL34337.1 hypothetical protein AWB65_02362 [Caballeronia humi]
MTTSTAREMLDAWRERGADRLNPVRFLFIDALERRAAGHVGEARRILDERLAGLLEAYADDLDKNDCAASPPIETTRGPLAELVDYIASNVSDDASTYPELEALDHFRETWSRVSTARQLRQSLAQVPGNAGPLNSSSLVHRSLSLMRELSPGYLQQFLSYVDALSWMEQLNGGVPAAKDAPRAGSARKSGRTKAR